MPQPVALGFKQRSKPEPLELEEISSTQPANPSRIEGKQLTFATISEDDFLRLSSPPPDSNFPAKTDHTRFALTRSFERKRIDRVGCVTPSFSKCAVHGNVNRVKSKHK